MKKIIKTTLQLLLLVLACFTLISCGEDENVEVDSEGNTIVKIMFHVNESSAEGQAYKKRIAAFNQAYKDKKIKASAAYVARTTGASQYEVDLTNRKIEGTLPDIITFDAPNCASYADAELLYNLDGLVSTEVLNDFISVLEYNNGIYGLPIQESSAGFFYNKKIFREAGINVDGYTVDNPWTFAEFEDVCNRLKAHQINNGYSKYPVDMRLDATKDETATYMLYSFIHATGGSFVSPDGKTATGYFNSSATAKGFNFIKGLVNKGYTGYDVGATDFFTGKMGMYLSSGWTIPQLDNEFREFFPNGRDSWGLLPYPKDVASASATGSWCFGLTDNGKSDKSAAVELLLWLTSAESSEAITAATGMIPARKSAKTDYAVGSPEYVLYNQLLKTGKARPATIEYPKFSVLFGQVISELKDGDVSAILDLKTKSLQAELDLNK